MKKEGTIIRWDDERGFGFVRSPDSTADVFLHVRDFRSRSGGPRQGMRITFEEIHMGGKGPRAVAAHPVGETAAPPPVPRARRKPARAAATGGPSSGAWLILPLMLAHAGFVLWATWSRLMPWWVRFAWVGVNAGAFMAYWIDKYAAQQRFWRTPELQLHVWSLFGGWSGAWFAQQLLRHKSRKVDFRDTYFATVVAHCAGLGYWFWMFRMQPAG